MGRVSGIASFDYEYYVERNKQSAHDLYGDRIGPDRRVRGTNIWFDSFWRLHISEGVDCK